MAETRQQASFATGIWESVFSFHFFQQFRANIAAAGLPPRKTLIGFALAWLIFFLILFGIPAPAGLPQVGKATLAVMAWACTIWVFEALPAGVYCALIDIGNLANCRIRISGRIDGYVKVGNPLEGNPFVHCPTFDWEISGAELLKGGALRKDLGGTELFLAVERVTDRALPRDIGGTLEIEPANGPHGFRPVYFYGRQTDDAKAWTSAMFIKFS